MHLVVQFGPGGLAVRDTAVDGGTNLVRAGKANVEMVDDARNSQAWWLLTADRPPVYPEHIGDRLVGETVAKSTIPTVAVVGLGYFGLAFGAQLARGSRPVKRGRPFLPRLPLGLHLCSMSLIAINVS